MSKNKFSITVQSDDFPFIVRLRGLALFCQNEMNDETETRSMEEEWLQRNHKVSFHFTSKENRSNFIQVAKEFSNPQLWKINELYPED
jgi:hypothetical protein